MGRRFHVIGVNADLTRTLTIPTSAGWLLPWFDDDARVALPAQLQTALSRYVAHSEMMHEAPIRTESASHLKQATCVALVSEPVLSTDALMVPHATLEATPALMALQQDAWRDAVERLHRPTAAFDSPAQVAAALDWTRRQIVERTGAHVLSCTRHRCTRNEYVVRLDTTSGSVYFKGGRDRVLDEGLLTDLLWRLAPSSFPETLAIDLISHRWAYRALAGETLSGSRLNPATVVTTVRTLVSAQKHALAAPTVEAHLHRRRLTAVELYDRVTTCLQLAWDSASESDAPVIAAWTERAESIRAECAVVDSLHVPLTVVFSDFCPRNILVTPNGIGFIDIEQSYWSYPFLTLWLFSHEVERLMHGDTSIRPLIEQVFVSEWADLVEVPDMRHALEHQALLGRLLNLLLVSREIDIEERNLSATVPTGYRALRLRGYTQRILAHGRQQ